jgi:hypothetical protein
VASGDLLMFARRLGSAKQWYLMCQHSTHAECKGGLFRLWTAACCCIVLFLLSAQQSYNTLLQKWDG